MEEAKALVCLFLKPEDSGKYTHNSFSHSPYDLPRDIHPWETRGYMKKEFQ
jgi:hypothetical protein